MRSDLTCIYLHDNQTRLHWVLLHHSWQTSTWIHGSQWVHTFRPKRYTGLQMRDESEWICSNVAHYRSLSFIPILFHILSIFYGPMKSHICLQVSF